MSIRISGRVLATFFGYVDPLSVRTVLTLQGAIADPGSVSPKAFSATNSVPIRVLP